MVLKLVRSGYTMDEKRKELTLFRLREPRVPPAPSLRAEGEAIQEVKSVPPGLLRLRLAKTALCGFNLL